MDTPLTAVDDNGNSFSVGSAYHCTSQKKLQLHQSPLQQACQVVFFHLEILSMWSEYIVTASAFFSDTIPSKCSTGVLFNPPTENGKLFYCKLYCLFCTFINHYTVEMSLDNLFQERSFYPGTQYSNKSYD